MSTPSPDATVDTTDTPAVCPTPPEKCRETRIGLVMYGGVSLAIYINGVSQEFYHAVQGNGVYRLIKELTDSEIVLDIVSGSSAGGINGILLGYALANGKDFTRCSDLWRNSADIRRLLRSTAATDEPIRSVLDSEGYYQTELENAFRMLEGTTAYAEAPSPLKELDLFVTGTDMDGRTYQRVDDAGHIIEVKDHRAIFHLKYREGRKSNFDSKKNPAVITALSKLARITSCFPGAFAPVFVSNSPIEGKNPDRMSANELLQYWGALPRAAYLIDGGVIDNKPFSHTIKEIFFRTTERKIERRLFYVEPDPERFPDPGRDFMPDAPSFLKPILSSLIAIPGYESITDDLKLLAERNENIREYRRVLQDVSRLYEREVATDYGPGIPEVDEPQKSIYARARYASISDRVLEGVFKNATFENSPRLDEQRAALVQEFDERTTSTAGGTTDTLRDFDVLFRLRRVFHLIYQVYEMLYEHPKGQLLPPDRAERYARLLKRLNRHMELLNVMYSAMEQLVDETNYGWNDKVENDTSQIWNKVAFSLHQLLQGEGLKQHLTDLKELNNVLHRRIAQIKLNIFDVPNFRSVLRDADALEAGFLKEMLEPGDPVLKRYLHFNEIDAHLFPIEWVSGLREKDVVQVCRVSPLDAQAGFSRRAAHEKTSGDSLAHFSAFFKRTWRSNDIMWGRLDGVCQLTEALLTKKALLEGMKNDASRMRARDTLLPPNGAPSPLDEWFKDSSEAAIQRIKSWIRKMTDHDPTIREQAVADLIPADPEQTGSVRELLIEMSQFRILHETLPQVFEDSIKEQVEWKRVRRRSRNDLEKLEWLDTDVAIDGAALDALAVLGGRKILEDMAAGRPLEESPQASRLGQAFSKFRIGSEEVLNGGLPPLVLADISSRALLVLRNCMLGSFSKGTAGKVRASTLYRWGVDLPLRAFHGLVIFLQTVPGFQAATFIGLSVISLLALLVGLTWKAAIIQPKGEFSILWFTIFIILPAIWLCSGLYQMSRSRLRGTQLSDSIRHALIAICTASPLISVILVYFGLTDLMWDWWSGTAEPAGTRDIQMIMILFYGIVPFLLSFLGGYLAIRQSRRALEADDYTAVLEKITESELQDVSDRMGEQHRVTSESRLDIAKALTVSAEMNHTFGKLDRAIRASSPGTLD
jgi:patatin-related protein